MPDDSPSGSLELNKGEEQELARLRVYLDLTGFSPAGLKALAGADFEQFMGRPAAPRDPSIVREAFLVLADNLRKLQEVWIAGDKKMLNLQADGVPPETGGFERIMLEERATIGGILECVRGWLLPIVSYVDYVLGDRVLEFLNNFEPRACLPNADGERRMRWRQTWSEIGLGAELERLFAALRAVGDSLVLPAGDAAPEGKEKDREQRRTRAPRGSRRKHEEVDALIERALKSLGEEGVDCLNVSASTIAKKAGLPGSTVRSSKRWKALMALRRKTNPTGRPMTARRRVVPIHKNMAAPPDGD